MRTGQALARVALWHCDLPGAGSGPAQLRERHRSAVRAHLARLVDREPEALRIAVLPGGKPVLLDRDHEGRELHFSVSHCGARLVVATSPDGPVGVDVEAEREVPVPLLAGRMLSPAERATLQALAPAARCGALLRAWTRKESVLKAIGIGLARDPSTLEVESVVPDVPRPLWHSAGPPWHLYDASGGGYAVAVAVSSPASVERTWAGA